MSVVGQLKIVDESLSLLPSTLIFEGHFQPPNDNRCHSIRLSTNGDLICGKRQRVEIWKLDLSELKYSIDVDGHISDIKQYGDHMYGLRVYERNSTLIRYDMDLTNKEEITKYLYTGVEPSHIDIRYGLVAFIEWDSRKVRLHTIHGEFVREVVLKDRGGHPYGVRLLMDDCIIVSDYAIGTVCKYRTDGTNSIVWKCSRLKEPCALHIDEWGMIYVGSNTTGRIYILSSNGMY